MTKSVDMQLSIKPQQPIKKKRGGYRPNSGRKRIHPIKEPKTTLNSPTTFPSVSSVVGSSIVKPNSTYVRSNGAIVQTFRDLAWLIQREHQKLAEKANDDIQVQDFEVELLLGLDPLKTFPSACSVWSTDVYAGGQHSEITDIRCESTFVLQPNESADGFFMYDDDTDFRKNRLLATNDERAFLEDHYRVNPNPCVEEMEQFCQILGWDIKRLKQWFSNKRAYGKRKTLTLFS